MTIKGTKETDNHAFKTSILQDDGERKFDM